jgi:hypothetical protein
LQKRASLTTTGWPQLEQKRGPVVPTRLTGCGNKEFAAPPLTLISPAGRQEVQGWEPGIMQGVECNHRGHNPDYHFGGTVLAPELKLGVAQPDAVAVLQRRFADLLPADIAPILTAEIF